MSDQRQQELRKKQVTLQAQAQEIAQQLKSVSNEIQTSKQREKNRQDTAAKETHNLSVARRAD